MKILGSKVLIILLFIIFSTGSFYYFYIRNGKSYSDIFPSNLVTDNSSNMNMEGEDLTNDLNPLKIDFLRKSEFPGSDIEIEETLPSGSNYKRYLASYKSEGFKIYALLTIPNSPPENKSGYPVVVFNHGYIPPLQYKTTERYVAYVDGFSRNGYIVFKPDYRGHGSSEGTPGGAYGSSDYTVDVLNAVSSIKKYSSVDPNKLGMWGHSMGGFLTLRSMVVSKDIKAGVIWGGVVGSYPDMINNWRRRNLTITISPTTTSSRRWRQALVELYGEPNEESDLWRSISSNSYLKDISGPLQIHHGSADASVPVSFSEKLHEQMKEASKTSELYIYEGDDHNISKNFSLAIKRSVDFFDRYLKTQQ